jgi:hypothetical protein
MKRNNQYKAFLLSLKIRDKRREKFYDFFSFSLGTLRLCLPREMCSQFNWGGEEPIFCLGIASFLLASDSGDFIRSGR